MRPWFDIGVNLTNARLEPQSSVQAAVAAGVTHIAITGTDIAESQSALGLAKRLDASLYCTAGIHPHDAQHAPEDYAEQISYLAGHPEVVAIGECGLDFNRNFSPKEDQLRVFEGQLQVAARLNMPVFLHERDAFDEQIRLLDKYLPEIPTGVAHCFTGNTEQMLAYLERGLYIGITGWLCDDKRGGDLRNAVQHLPLERVVLETDAPFLTPKTLRPKRSTNQPANLPYIAQTLAELMQVSVEDLNQAAWRNSCALFQLNDEGEPFAP